MTATTKRKPGTSTRLLSLPTPVELIENDGHGSTWLKLAEAWVKVTAIKNLWEMDGYGGQEQPVVRMHFRVTTQEGRTLLLFQDLLEGQWYREFTLGNGDRDRSVPIYRA
jgi:hypothetical protein